MAEPDQTDPKYSIRLLSDALEARRTGKLCRIAFAPRGGSDTLARSTEATPVSASLDLAFCPATDVPLAVVRCCHDRVLSELAVRVSGGSMLRLELLNPCLRGVYVGRIRCFSHGRGPDTMAI